MTERALSLLVRKARPADAQELHRVQEQIYREGRWFVGEGPPSPLTLERRIAAASDATESLYLVAVVGAVAGWLELHRLPARRMNHVATLTLAVGSAHRGRGIGSALLREGLAWARTAGLRKVSLDVRAGNQRAIRLYQRFGFELEGREREQVRCDDGFEDILVMARFLTH